MARARKDALLSSSGPGGAPWQGGAWGGGCLLLSLPSAHLLPHPSGLKTEQAGHPLGGRDSCTHPGIYDVGAKKREMKPTKEVGSSTEHLAWARGATGRGHRTGLGEDERPSGPPCPGPRLAAPSPAPPRPAL